MKSRKVESGSTACDRRYLNSVTSYFHERKRERRRKGELTTKIQPRTTASLMKVNIPCQWQPFEEQWESTWSCPQQSPRSHLPRDWDEYHQDSRTASNDDSHYPSRMRTAYPWQEPLWSHGEYWRWKGYQDRCAERGSSWWWFTSGE